MGASPIAEESGTDILPIPPALEFPFPRSSGDSARAAKVPAPAPIPGHNTTAINGGITTAENGVAPGQPNLFDTRRPKPKRRFMSERPVQAQRSSFRAGLKRGQTGYAPTVLNKCAGGSDSNEDTSTSSDDDDSAPRPSVRPSNLSGRTPSAREPRGSKIDVESRRSSSSRQFSKFAVGNDSYTTKGRVSKNDGRLNISVNETNNRGYLAHALGATLQRHLTRTGDVPEADQTLSPLREDDAEQRPELVARLSALSQRPSLDQDEAKPVLNIVIMVIGSRGDIQPFLKVGKLLKEDHGHRVRIATHPAFKKFVEQDSGLEFFSVGGDPAELMAFMVKNPGLMPSVSTVRAGEIGRKRDSMFEMFQGFWRACINATDDETDESNLKMMGDKHPFVADAIIANPPSFAHIHCAERLGIPLHLMFTFPYSPTQQFPHPLANIKQSNVDTNYTNFISYPLVEMMTWQGLGDLVNRFRVKTLGLEPVSTLWAPGQLFRLKVPYTYMWSPGLIPKPADWGPEIDISGFVFLDLASNFKPPESLAQFLDAGEPPVYIGFGSIVIDDPDRFTSLIFEAVQKAGVRALVSKGWGGLGDEGNTPDNIYMLENTPHDWLFPRVSAVVHHGGAGTTAIGLKCGKPTMIVPFFGDQPFWGAMVARAGAGAEPVPYKRLTSDKLAEGIKHCLSLEAKEAAQALADGIEAEGDGAQNAVESFHRQLSMRGDHSLRCSMLPDRVAVWALKHSNLKICALAAQLLVEKRKIKWQDLRLVRHKEWNDFEGPGEPLTGGGAALMNVAGGVVKGVGGVPVRWARTVRNKEKRAQNQNERTRSSVAPRNSLKTERSPKLKEHAEKLRQAENTKESGSNGGLPHGGQCSAEAGLPKAHSSTGHIVAPSERVGSLPNSETRPMPLNQHGAAAGVVSADETSNISEESDNLAQELAEDTGAGLAKAGEALAKAPMDLSLAIAQGFHNAPRLYGDTTVRTPPRVSGIRSGLRAAGSEFTFGIYDGVTGLFLQPYRGAQKNGALGFVQGVGKGFGGFVLKDIAAIIGPFGYTLKGVHKEIIKGRQPTAFIRRARQIQGGDDERELDSMAKQRESTKVDTAWRIVCEIRKEDEARMDEGLKGRVTVLKQRRRMGKQGTYETVGHAKKALEAKQEDRRERMDLAAARSSGEDARGTKIFSMKGRLLKSNTHKGTATSNGHETNGHAKGADRDVKSQTLDLGKEGTPMNGDLKGRGKPVEGLVNGTVDVAA